ncbi:PepSY-associated TM helix domain-containing protein [Saprospira sp. CCB-QB6]|uniref:PepSY-associated TM helix domain-containing protein n=1 Tax=Saprospira sp. CCB-QB6 TaxID=3023936 RepID=UPI00234B05C7|nr:PepSY-associated TM helix domain-containing protein [Saprospira sp. CCB-QB6]WCL80937.1 PepSY-associated TM helix domain-containing protein [Saprospira sp. CCB-QB6]
MKLKKALFPKKKKKESWFKYISGILHLWLGLLSSLVVFIICLSGSIYAFKTQINDYYNAEKVFVEAPAQPQVNIAAIEALFEREGREITAIVIPEQPNRSYSISFREQGEEQSKTQYFDPYRQQLLGYRSIQLDDFFELILSLHKSLWIPGIGKQIVGISSLIFCLLLLSGLVLWFPKNMRNLKRGFYIKFKAKFYRINYDLHKVLGFYSSLLLLFIALTGAYITYPWMKNVFIVSLGGHAVASEAAKEELSEDFDAVLKQMLAKEQDKKQMAELSAVSFDSIYHLTNKQLPYAGAISIVGPNDKESEFKVTKLNTSNLLGAILPDELAFNKKGELKNQALFADQALHKQFIEIAKPLHTGEILGIKSIILYFIMALIGCSLPITGFIFWWKKVK